MNLREADILVDRLLSEAETLEKNFEKKATVLLEKAEKAKTASESAISQLEIQMHAKVERIRQTAQNEEATLRQIVADERTKMLAGKGRLQSIAKQLRAKHAQALATHERELKLAIKKATSTSKSPEAEASPSRETTAGDARASTLAIFDSIVFAISNWSNEGDSAPDFELACQSVLFPVIYERVMKGEDDYYMEEVPSTAYEVVAMGREFVKHLRNICNASLVDENAWEKHAPSVQRWWVNDALPHLYGARADEWADDTPYSLLEVQTWKSQPASRALRFPLIFDGMELVEKHRDQIRETTGLPEFNKQTLQTRLQP